jgi:hypothetical protein
MLTRAALAAFFVTVGCVVVLAVATPPGSAKTLDTGSPTGEVVGAVDPHHTPPSPPPPPPHHDPHDLLPPANPPVTEPPDEDGLEETQQPAADEVGDQHHPTPPDHHQGPPEEPEEEPDCEDFFFPAEFGDFPEFPWWCYIDWEGPGFPGLERVA